MINGFYSHLTSYSDLGTYGCPHFPPPGAMVLPAVGAVLKLVINKLKQEPAHKIHICAHGRHQVHGGDYKKFYAHTDLSPSLGLKILTAV